MEVGDRGGGDSGGCGEGVQRRGIEAEWLRVGWVLCEDGDGRRRGARNSYGWRWWGGVWRRARSKVTSRKLVKQRSRERLEFRQ